MILGGSLGRKGAGPHHVCPQGVALSELRTTLQPGAPQGARLGSGRRATLSGSPGQACLLSSS